jgi:hypothetical protein
MAGHAEILAAREAGDAQRAVEATRDHILGAHRLMMPADYRAIAGSALDVALTLAGGTKPASDERS